MESAELVGLVYLFEPREKHVPHCAGNTSCISHVVYRIAQELLNNSLKHSKATFIGFSISQEGGVLQVGFRDNGIGFVPSKVKLNVGLLNMKSRAQAVSGTFEFRSSPGSGFQARLEIPLETNK